MKSQSDQIKGHPCDTIIGECRIPGTLEKALYRGIYYRDLLFPVRIIINARTAFPREAEKEQMAEETFDKMVGNATGKFGSIKQDGKMYGPFS
jgi:hypothetical protein